MKNIFEVEYGTGIYQGEDFIKRRLTEEEYVKICDEQIETNNKKLEKSKIDWAGIIKKICGMFGLFLLFLGIGILFNSKNANDKALIFIIFGIAFILLFIIVEIVNRIKKEDKKLKEEIDLEEQEKGLDVKEDENYKEFKPFYQALNVPAKSELIDVFTYIYKVENGIRVGIKNKVDYSCYAYRFYTENNKLIIADDTCLLSIPKEKIVQIKKYIQPIKVEYGYYENISKMLNNKNLSIKKIGNNKYELGMFYLLLIKHNKEDYSIIFPEYELEKIKRITGV